MRLYLNDKEARLIKLTLSYNRGKMVDEQQKVVDRILDRIDLCEKLQNNERGSKKDA